MEGFDVVIYMDALSLLLSEKTDIKEAVINQLNQEPDVLEELELAISDAADEVGLDCDKVWEDFMEADIKELMSFIIIKENDVTFDYDESAACEDLRVVAFNIPCDFDVDKYIKSIM